MAETPQGLPTPGQELVWRAQGLAKVLGIPAETFAGQERKAYAIMANVAAVPTIQDHDRRRAYINEILANAEHLMPHGEPQNGPFFRDLDMIVGTMQELPAFYARLSVSNEQLVNDYCNLKLIAGGMEVVGMGNLTFNNVTGGAVTGGLRGLQDAQGGRLARAAATARGAARGAGSAATGGLARGAALAWAIGSFVYLGVKQSITELGDEITRRYRERRLPEQLYQKAFGKDTALPQQYFFPIR